MPPLLVRGGYSIELKNNECVQPAHAWQFIAAFQDLEKIDLLRSICCVLQNQHVKWSAPDCGRWFRFLHTLFEKTPHLSKSDAVERYDHMFDVLVHVSTLSSENQLPFSRTQLSDLLSMFDAFTSNEASKTPNYSFSTFALIRNQFTHALNHTERETLQIGISDTPIKTKRAL
jgi:hypothetical protein